MGEWVPKEEWEAGQRANKNKQKVKVPLIIPYEVKQILNPAERTDIIENFLTCICNKIKNLYSISDGIVKLRCMGCGMEYGYPEDHYYFNLKPTRKQSDSVPIICTCSKCNIEISAAQSKSSLGFIGKDLCMVCMGAELV